MDISRRSVLKGAIAAGIAYALGPVAGLAPPIERARGALQRTAAVAVPGRLTVPSGMGGKYIVRAWGMGTLHTFVNPDGTEKVLQSLKVRKNGQDIVAASYRDESIGFYGGGPELDAVAIVDLDPGDWIGLEAHARTYISRLDTPDAYWAGGDES